MSDILIFVRKWNTWYRVLRHRKAFTFAVQRCCELDALYHPHTCPSRVLQPDKQQSQFSSP